MKPRIEWLTTKKLIGKHLVMSLSADQTPGLWRSFMPQRKNIQHTVNNDLYELLIYDPSLSFNDFNHDTLFEKWVTVEVSSIDTIPDDMEAYILKGGSYAVFTHKGPAATFQKTFQSIFTEWLPNSEYLLDKREHFQLLGEKYKNNEPDSEEEVWIPIKRQ